MWARHWKPTCCRSRQACADERWPAHYGRAGDAALLAGYMSDGDGFDEAIAGFAEAYADQTKKDYALFCAA